MGKLKTDDTSKPAPKNRVSVLFILSLAVILAVIGVTSWSFFGKHARQGAPVSTASTSIEPPVEIKPLSPVEPEKVETSQTEEAPSTPEISSKKPEAAMKPEVSTALEESTEVTQEVPVADKLQEEPVSTDPKSISQKSAIPVQDLPSPPESTSSLPVSEAVKLDNGLSDPEPDPLPKEETPGMTDTTEEVPPQATEIPEIVATAPQEISSSSDTSLPQPAPDEIPADTAVETPPVAKEEAGEAITNFPVMETQVETSDRSETPTPLTAPDVAEEPFTLTETAKENAPEALEGASPTVDTTETDAPQPAEEAIEPEPETEVAAEVASTSLEESISGDTQLPWRKYAASFDEMDKRPRIAIVISEAGISSSRTRDAIVKLPPEVTLGFNPYGQNLQELVDLARKAGHEVLLQLPMEPKGYPRIDPGPQAMRTDLDEIENRAHLEWAMNRFTGYAGVTNQMGSKFTSDAESIQPVLAVLKQFGLLYLDSRTASDSVAAKIAQELDIPVAINNRFLDHKADGALIDARLTELESIAQKTGSAIGIAYPNSETFRHLSDWADTLDQKGLALAPVSAVVKGKKEQ